MTQQHEPLNIICESDIDPTLTSTDIKKDIAKLNHDPARLLQNKYVSNQLECHHKQTTKKTLFSQKRIVLFNLVSENKPRYNPCVSRFTPTTSK